MAYPRTVYWWSGYIVIDGMDDVPTSVDACTEEEARAIALSELPPWWRPRVRGWRWSRQGVFQPDGTMEPME